jgi:dCMP deaminase
MVHGEMNCIYNATRNGTSLKDATLYVHGLPVCSECAKGVVQVGIKRVMMRYKLPITDKWKESFNETSQMLAETGIEWTCYGVYDSGAVDITSARYG